MVQPAPMATSAPDVIVPVALVGPTSPVNVTVPPDAVAGMKPGTVTVPLAPADGLDTMVAVPLAVSGATVLSETVLSLPPDAFACVIANDRVELVTAVTVQSPTRYVGAPAPAKVPPRTRSPTLIPWGGVLAVSVATLPATAHAVVATVGGTYET